MGRILLALLFAITEVNFFIAPIADPSFKASTTFHIKYNIDDRWKVQLVVNIVTYRLVHTIEIYCDEG